MDEKGIETQGFGQDKPLDFKTLVMIQHLETTKAIVFGTDDQADAAVFTYHALLAPYFDVRYNQGWKTRGPVWKDAQKVYYEHWAPQDKKKANLRPILLAEYEQLVMLAHRVGLMAQKSRGFTAQGRGGYVQD